MTASSTTTPGNPGFDQLFQGWSVPRLGGFGYPAEFSGDSLLRPQVDLSAADKDYLLTVEIPGVSEKGVSAWTSATTS